MEIAVDDFMILESGIPEMITRFIGTYFCASIVCSFIVKPEILHQFAPFLEAHLRVGPRLAMPVANIPNTTVEVIIIVPLRIAPMVKHSVKFVLLNS